MFDEKEEKHESFGMMGFSRVQCSGDGQVLHGSDLKHNTIIRMTLSHGTKKRGLSHDWYHAEDTIVEVEMSQNQFSEMITSMNMGSGIPVTLNYTEKDGRLESPEFVSVVEIHENEFKQQTKDTVKDMEDLLTAMKDLLSGSGTVKKADRETMINQAEKVVREIGSNMPYMEKCFAESMDKVVTDAKGNIEAFYQHRVIAAGLEALENGNEPKLIEKN